MMRPWLTGVMLAWVILAFACDDADPIPNADRGPSVRRDIDELQRLIRTPRACAETADCPIGSHCDDESDTCRWACLADSECGIGRGCDAGGSCVASADVGFATLANQVTGCDAIPAPERRAALIELHENAQDGTFIVCDRDESCPCGSYCSVDAICQVDCIGDAPPPELTCGAGLSCTALGRCGLSPTEPGPPLAFTIAFSEPVTTANTAAAPVVMPLQVTIAATNLDLLAPTSPAVVKLTIAEVRAFEQRRVNAAPAIAPRMRCAPNAPLATSCTIDGGWTFNVVSGELHSAPKPIWVEIPQTPTPLQWTLEARSEWAADPAVNIVHAASEVIPSTDPGRYRGTLSLPNSGEDPLSLPIEALVTTTHIAVFEPTRLVLPDGHVVLARDASKATTIAWLTSGSSQYDVVLGAPQVAYNATTGELDVALALTNGTGAEATSLDLALRREGAVDAPSCPCGTGSYCNAAMNLCLPGASAPSSAIVNAASAVPSSVLPSATLTTWAGPVATAVASKPLLLAGTGRTGIERPYCFRMSGPSLPPGAPTFGAPAMPDSVSEDLLCTEGGVSGTKYAQPTFAFADVDREYDDGSSGGEEFDLFETCLGDLGAAPAGPMTPESLLAPAKGCVSLARFVAAITANAPSGIGEPLPDIGHRLLAHVLRQWLGVNAYVASGAVKVRRYDDALSLSNELAHERLGGVIARIDDGLRVLLDQRVRPQFATGAALPVAMSQPDYRITERPVTRWTFNATPSPVPDVEGTTRFIATGVDLTAHDLHSNAPPGTQTCTSESAVALDDHRFTIAAHLRYTPIPGAMTIVFEKRTTSSNRLWLELTAADGGLVNLRLRDSFGGVATFDPIALGMIAITADHGSYRLIHSGPSGKATELLATSVSNGGPRWGAPGLVRLACALPLGNGTCTSWDRNAVGDNLDVLIRAPYNSPSATNRRTCSTQKFYPYDTTCTGPAPSSAVCTNGAATKRTQIIQTLFSNPPAFAVNNLRVTGALAVLATGEDETDRFSIEWTEWRCNYTVTNHPMPVTGTKPVCPKVPQTIRWDEISLWNRPVTADEVGAMAQRYGDITANESLPPEPLQLASGNEQSVALPAHLIEAASADLELLTEYIAAERSVMYEECYRAGPSPARDRVADIAGRNLRLIAILEGEAEHLAAVPGATSTEWYARYEASRQVLAGRRARAIRELQLATECHNPLGITENDLPLYIGEEVGSAERFFASSRFLAAKAREEILFADNKMASAQAKYVQQRETEYQISANRETKVQREAKLRADYESVLVRACGAPANGQKLLDGFLAGTLTPANCFFKTESPSCQDAASLPLEDVPSTCMRGDIGARLLAIQAANIDMRNAVNNHARAMEQFDADSQNCARRKAALEQEEVELAKHHAHMESLRNRHRTWGRFVGALSSMAKLKAENLVGSAGVLAGVQAALGVASAELNAQRENGEAEERERFALVMADRSHEAEIAQCYHNVDNQKFTIDAARDLVDRVHHDVTSSQYQLENDHNALLGHLTAAVGQLTLEAELDATPPHLHYWLDAEIAEYHRHLEYGRRLTYLAVRAFEYESQQSFPYRGQTLTARRPGDLMEVVLAIEQRNAPMQGELGYVIGQRPIVLSLRDEILRMPDLVAGTTPLPGEPPLTPEQAFKRYLASDSAKILDANGREIGRGIRFSLRPGAWTEFSCAERIWRIAPSLQIDNPPTQHQMVLYQDNAFGSQNCRGAFGDVTVSRAQPFMNLLTGDAAQFETPRSSTSMIISGELGLDHETLRLQPVGDISGFAGRGLYGNYVLLFGPQTWPDVQLSKIKDVLLRFDIVEVTHSPPL